MRPRAGDGRLRVGLVWKAGDWDDRRSIPVDLLAPLAQVPGVTLNRMCGSGQQAVHFAAQAILAGDMHLVIAGGTEMMSLITTLSQQEHAAGWKPMGIGSGAAAFCGRCWKTRATRSR